MTSTPPARRIPSACKTPNKHPVQHLPVSCVGGAQKKPLRWRVEDEPCHNYVSRSSSSSNCINSRRNSCKQTFSVHQ